MTLQINDQTLHKIEVVRNFLKSIESEGGIDNLLESPNKNLILSGYEVIVTSLLQTFNPTSVDLFQLRDVVFEERLKERSSQ